MSGGPLFSKIALAGNPNCGKSALFNALTGGRAKVGNYPGVTVESKESTVVTAQGTTLNIHDLPGTYSLDAVTPDEAITRDILLGSHFQEKSPDILVAVADATHLERSLGLVLELRALNKPVILALNMMDLAKKRGLIFDLKILSQELGVPIVPTVAVKNEGISELLDQIVQITTQITTMILSSPTQNWVKATAQDIRDRFAEVDRILKLSTQKSALPFLWTDKIDKVLLHPVLGTFILISILCVVFQAIFTWARLPMEAISHVLEFIAQSINSVMADGPLRSLLVDGILTGVGSVLVFLPQILLLFLFISFLEDSGYMARAGFLMDRLMGKVGLHGRAFIPLLSSFACAIPGIMATRTIEHRRDRLTTILIAPLMTCSARLPIYSLLIASFIPNTLVFGFFRLQGLVMLGLYLAGIIAALVMSIVFRLTLLKGPTPVLLMELPSYKWPRIKNILANLIERSRLFVINAGTVILTASIILWFLASYPKAPPGVEGPGIAYSYAGRIGQWIEPVVKPIGFNWKIAVALIPGFTAREVMIGSLATVYAVEKKGENLVTALETQLSNDWSVATGLSLLVWYILACQCLSTLAVTYRETNSWKWPAFMLFYMTSLGYLGSFFTYRLALSWGLG